MPRHHTLQRFWHVFWHAVYVLQGLLRWFLQSYVCTSRGVGTCRGAQRLLYFADIKTHRFLAQSVLDACSREIESDTGLVVVYAKDGWRQYVRFPCSHPPDARVAAYSGGADHLSSNPAFIYLLQNHTAQSVCADNFPVYLSQEPPPADHRR